MRPRQYLLDENHNPYPTTDLVAFGRMYERDRDRIVAQTDVPHVALVSTIFLGLDHNFLGEGPPILFETMILWEDGRRGEYQRRYATWNEALAGHTEALREVEKVRTPLLARVKRFMFGE